MSENIELKEALKWLEFKAAVERGEIVHDVYTNGEATVLLAHFEAQDKRIAELKKENGELKEEVRSIKNRLYTLKRID